MANTTSKLVIGNVGRDPEMRYTQQGKAVCDFSLAEEEYLGRNPDGTANKRTTWWKVVAWEETAEKVKASISKGARVALLGRASADAYMGNDGTAKSNLVLTLDKFDSLFIAPAASGNPASTSSADNGYTAPYSGNSINEDEIPF